ncbi:MAG: T9SS type A sorting domain-containing protein [Bacteroidota bacterium]
MTLPKLLFSISLLAFGMQLQAQDMPRSVVGSAGAYFSNVNTGNLHWTVGEVAVDYSVNGITLAQGFHQGYYDLVISSIFEAPELNLSLTAFPNPTMGQLTLEGTWDRGDRVQMTDLMGRPVIEAELDPNRMDFDMANYPNGVYLLSVSREGRILKTFQVIKQ